MKKLVKLNLQTEIRLSSSSDTVCEALPPDDILLQFIVARDLHDHLRLLKQIVDTICSQPQLPQFQPHFSDNDQVCQRVKVLADIFFNLPPRNQLKKAVASSLQVLFGRNPLLVSSCLKDVVMSTLRSSRSHIGKSIGELELRRLLNHSAATLDIIPLGESCMVGCWESVIQFVAEALVWYLDKIRSGLSPVELTERMLDILAVIQLHNRLLQKTLVSHVGRLDKCDTQVKITEEVKPYVNTSFKVLIDCFCEIMSHEIYMSDCLSAAAMGLVIIIKFLCPRESVIGEVQRCLLDAQCTASCDDSSVVAPSKNDDGSYGVPSDVRYSNILETLSFSQLRNLPTESCICLLGAVIAVVDIESLATCDETFVPPEPFITCIITKRLLRLSDQLNSTGMKLIYSRTLALLVTKNRMILELGDELPNGAVLSMALSGCSPASIQLTQYSWTHWDDPVDVIRHQARVIFEQVVHCHLLATKEDPRTSEFLSTLARSLLDLEWFTRAKYGPLCCLVHWLGASTLLAFSPRLPQLTLLAMADQSVASHVGEFLGKLYASHLAELKYSCHGDQSTEDTWSVTWIEPVLNCLTTASEVHSTLITEYVIKRLVETCPQTLEYISTKLTSNDFNMNGSLLRALIACYKHATISSVSKSGRSNIGIGDAALSPSLLSLALCHSDDQVRLDALGLLCDHYKTTAPVTQQDLELIRFFVRHNMDSQLPAFRQTFIATLKKLLTRLLESGKSLLRQWMIQTKLLAHPSSVDVKLSDDVAQPRTLCEDQQSIRQQLDAYKDFVGWLVGMCFDILHPAASFPARTTSLGLLSMLVRFVGVEDLSDHGIETSLVDLIDERRELVLVECLMDTFEQNKIAASSILSGLPAQRSLFNNPIKLDQFMRTAIELAQSTRPQDGITAAYLLRFLLKFPGTCDVLHHLCGEYRDVKVSIPLHQPTCGVNESYYLCCVVLLILLRQQLSEANINLLRASATRPMYPTMLCIRYIIEDASLRSLEPVYVDKWRSLLNPLIITCFKVAEVVAPIVNNSSPEGNIPDDVYISSSTEGAAEDCKDESDSDAAAKVQLMPEYLVVCGWRSIKEVSLLLGQLMSTCPLRNSTSGKSDEHSAHLNETHVETQGLIDIEMVLAVGKYFTKQLLESRHRGAFELAYAGFILMTEMLWRSPVAEAHCLPRQWLQDLMAEVRVHDPNDRLCSTRRSAGIPFFVQALVTMEPAAVGRTCFKSVMSEALQLANLPADFENTAKIHSLNILRALFRDTRLGEDVFPYVADGVKIAILGYSSTYWPIRNASALLFSALVTRIFGVKKSKALATSRYDLMTGRVFFNRFPTLFAFFVDQLRISTTNLRGENGAVQLNPGLYPLLIVLGRLCPSVAEGANSKLRLEELVPFVVRCASNPVYKARIMAARAIRPLLSTEHFTSVLTMLLDNLKMHNGNSLDDMKGHNLVHGSLLQIIELLKEVRLLSKATQASVLQLLINRISESVWLLSEANPCSVTRSAFAVVTYAVLSIKWSPILCDQEAQTYKNFEANIHCLTVSQLLSHIKNSHRQPFSVEWVSQLARLFLHHSGVEGLNVGDETAHLLLELLSSDLYDLRLTALQFFAGFLREECESSDENCHPDEADEDDEPLSDGHATSKTPGSTMKIIQFLKTSDGEGVLSNLVSMVMEKENNGDCLALALDVLMGCLANDENLISMGNSAETLGIITKLLQRAVCLARNHQRESVKCSAVHLLTHLFSLYYQKQPKNVENRKVEPCPVVKDLCDILETHSGSLIATEMRMACCHVIVYNVEAFLIDPRKVVAGCNYSMWSTLLRLLQDEDGNIRQHASTSFSYLHRHSSQNANTVSPSDLQPRLVLDRYIDTFIQLHLDGKMSWQDGGLQLVLHWLLHDIDPGWQEEEKSVRLFDRGDLNSYKDELGFVSILANKFELVSVNVESMQCAWLQKQLCDLSADIEKLANTINTRTEIFSFRPMFQKQCVEDAVALVRKTAALHCLRRILTSVGKSLPMHLVS